MARTIGGGESSAPGRNVFGVKRVVYPVARMAAPKRQRLRKRLQWELGAVRDLIGKAELYSCVPAAAGKEDRRLFAPEPAAEDGGGCGAAKSTKVSERERLAGRLASMAAALPDHVVAFLENRRVGEAEGSRGGAGAGDGEIEMDDARSMKDGALFQLKMLLDKFAPAASTPKLLLVDKLAPEVSTPKSRGGRAPLALAASGISCLSSQAQNREAGGRMSPVQEEEEEEEGKTICGGVSRIEIRDIAEEYGELVDGIGVQLLSPLQRKYIDLAEQGGYVDICGDASPVVFPAKTGDSSSSSSSSPSLSTSSDSDATSTDSDSSSSSPEALPKKNPCCKAGEPVPAPEADPIQGKHNAPPSEAAPETIQIAEPENQCAAMVIAITKSPPAPTVLPRERGALAQPPPLEQAPEAVQIAEPEELKQKCVAPAATVRRIAGSGPPPAVLPDENAGTSSQPAPVPAQIAEPQPQPQPLEVQTSDLIALARQVAKRRAMTRARQKLLAMKRAVLPGEHIHPLDMELLGIAAFEHVVSTVRDGARTAQPQVNDGAGLRVPPGRPSILQQLGIFLKADGGSEEEDEEEQPPPLAVASGDEGMVAMEIEDGQILEKRK